MSLQSWTILSSVSITCLRDDHVTSLHWLVGSCIFNHIVELFPVGLATGTTLRAADTIYIYIYIYIYSCAEPLHRTALKPITFYELIYRGSLWRCVWRSRRTRMLTSFTGQVRGQVHGRTMDPALDASLQVSLSHIVTWTNCVHFQHITKTLTTLK